MSLVAQLEAKALDTKVELSDLLRYALVVAFKLQLAEFEQWVNQELRGYDAAATVPPYRKLNGVVRARNPFHGWIAVQLSPEQKEQFTDLAYTKSISEIEALLRGGGMLTVPLEPARSALGTPFETVLHISDASMHNILGAVRDVVLNWSLQLQRDGIHGEGMAFSSKEVELASGAASHVNNFFGPVGNAQIAQSSPGTTQINAPLTFQRAELEAFVPAARYAFEQHKAKLGEEDAGEAAAALATIEAQAKAPKPSQTIVRESLLSLKRILEGVLSEGGKQMIPALADMFAKLF